MNSKIKILILIWLFIHFNLLLGYEPDWIDLCNKGTNSKKYKERQKYLENFGISIGKTKFTPLGKFL